MSNGALAAGDRVRDRKRPLPDKTGTVLLVVPLPPEQFFVDALGRTVAEDNPKYPADAVAAVVWDDQFDGAGEALESRRGAVIEQDLTVYHFPVTRLVLEAAVADIPPEELQPSPYHHRTFDPDANRQYITQVRDLGYIESVPLARPTPGGPELVDGHKRRWVAEQAGLDTMAVQMVDLDEWTAAQHYIHTHQGSLEAAEAERTIRALRDRWGARIEDLDISTDLS